MPDLVTHISDTAISLRPQEKQTMVTNLFINLPPKVLCDIAERLHNDLPSLVNLCLVSREVNKTVTPLLFMVDMHTHARSLWSGIVNDEKDIIRSAMNARSDMGFAWKAPPQPSGFEITPGRRELVPTEEALKWQPPYDPYESLAPGDMVLVWPFCLAISFTMFTVAEWLLEKGAYGFGEGVYPPDFDFVSSTLAMTIKVHRGYTTPQVVTLLFAEQKLDLAQDWVTLLRYVADEDDAELTRKAFQLRVDRGGNLHVNLLEDNITTAIMETHWDFIETALEFIPIDFAALDPFVALLVLQGGGPEAVDRLRWLRNLHGVNLGARVEPLRGTILHSMDEWRLGDFKSTMEVVTMIKALGLLDLCDNEGQTALHVACENMAPLAIEALRKAGAAWELQNHNGRTPLGLLNMQHSWGLQHGEPQEHMHVLQQCVDAWTSTSRLSSRP